MDEGCFVGTYVFFDWLVDVPLVDEVFLPQRTLVLKHNCYYTNTNQIRQYHSIRIQPAPKVF